VQDHASDHEDEENQIEDEDKSVDLGDDSHPMKASRTPYNVSVIEEEDDDVALLSDIAYSNNMDEKRTNQFSMKKLYTNIEKINEEEGEDDEDMNSLDRGNSQGELQQWEYRVEPMNNKTANF